MAVLIGLVVATLAVLVVLDPILRPARAAAPSNPEPEDDPKEQKKELALAALKEIEFDRATGKLSDGDYQTMLTRYTKEAVEALREAEAPAARDATVPTMKSSLPFNGVPLSSVTTTFVRSTLPVFLTL